MEDWFIVIRLLHDFRYFLDNWCQPLSRDILHFNGDEILQNGDLLEQQHNRQVDLLASNRCLALAEDCLNLSV